MGAEGGGKRAREGRGIDRKRTVIGGGWWVVGSQKDESPRGVKDWGKKREGRDREGSSVVHYVCRGRGQNIVKNE